MITICNKITFVVVLAGCRIAGNDTRGKSKAFFLQCAGKMSAFFFPYPIGSHFDKFHPVGHPEYVVGHFQVDPFGHCFEQGIKRRFCGVDMGGVAPEYEVFALYGAAVNRNTFDRCR